MIIDTHAHYDDDAFSKDRDTVLQELKQSGIELVVNVGASMASSKNTVELCKKYDFVYGAVGVHPNETAELTKDCIEQLREYSINLSSLMSF